MCEKEGWCSANHHKREFLEAFRNNLGIRQFLVSLSKHTDEVNYNGMIELADALEDVFVHLTKHANLDESDKNELLSHVATIDDHRNPSVFVAQL